MTVIGIIGLSTVLWSHHVPHPNHAHPSKCSQCSYKYKCMLQRGEETGNAVTALHSKIDSRQPPQVLIALGHSTFVDFHSLLDAKTYYCNPFISSCFIHWATNTESTTICPRWDKTQGTTANPIAPPSRVERLDRIVTDINNVFWLLRRITALLMASAAATNADINWVHFRRT